MLGLDPAAQRRRTKDAVQDRSPVISHKEKWSSVVENLEAIDGAYGREDADKAG